MENLVSKSNFKAKALQYLRQVESTGKELVITDHGKPVLKIIPYRRDPGEALRALRGTVIRYVDPLEPAGLEEDWESLSQLPEVTEQQRLAELESRGLMRLPRQPERGVFQGPVFPNRGKLASEMVSEDRR